MSLLYTKRDLRSVSALGDVGNRQFDWLRGEYQDSPDEVTSAVQRQKLLPVSDHPVIVKISGSVVTNPDRTAGQLHSVDLPKGQEWPKSHVGTMQDFEMWDFVVGAVVRTMTEPVQQWNYVTDSLRENKIVSDQEMLADMLHDLFHNANDEVFEDGMISHFSDELHHIVQKHGDRAVERLGAVICAADTPIRVAEEALRQVGYMNDKKTHSARLSLLEHSLESPDMRIRDAASIGIEVMEDPAAIPALKRAIENEQIGWLRQYLEDVTNQLKTRHEVPEES